MRCGDLTFQIHIGDTRITLHDTRAYPCTGSQLVVLKVPLCVIVDDFVFCLRSPPWLFVLMLLTSSIIFTSSEYQAGSR